MDDPIEEKVTTIQTVFNVAEMEHRKSSDFISIYANSASFGMNFFDLSILFGQITFATPGTMYVEDRALVTMSLEHARALQRALAESISSYEKVHGAVRPAPPLEQV